MTNRSTTSTSRAARCCSKWLPIWRRRRPHPRACDARTALAGLILTHLGYSTEPSLEPGADMRRDALARRLDEWLSPATPYRALPVHGPEAPRTGAA